MSQPHPPVTPARWPVAPPPSFADWQPRPAAEPAATMIVRAPARPVLPADEASVPPAAPHPLGADGR